MLEELWSIVLDASPLRGTDGEKVNQISNLLMRRSEQYFCTAQGIRSVAIFIVNVL